VQLVKRDFHEAVKTLEALDADDAWALLLKVYNSPNTPQDAAKLLEAMDLDKAVEIVKAAVDQGATAEIAEVLQYLSVERLNQVFAALPISYKAAILQFLSEEAKASLVPEVIGMQDLVVAAINLEQKAYESHQCNVSVLVVNAGSECSGTLEVKVYINGSLFYEFYVEFIEPWDVSNVTFAWTPSEAGVYNVSVEVMPSDYSLEFNVSNNAMSKLITVDPALPDLTALIYKPKSGDFLSAGDSVEVVVFVENNGVEKASKFSLSLIINGTYLGSVNFSGLEPDKKSMAIFKWTPNTGGFYLLSCYVDEDGAVAELNETNNEYCLLAKVLDKVTIPSEVFSKGSLFQSSLAYYVSFVLAISIIATIVISFLKE